MDDVTNWRQQLDGAMADAGDPGPVIAFAPDEAAFEVAFDGGFGSSSGPAVLAWTATHVYFPVVYDGSESLGSAPRNPTKGGQSHVGGE